MPQFLRVQPLKGRGYGTRIRWTLFDLTRLKEWWLAASDWFTTAILEPASMTRRQLWPRKLCRCRVSHGKPPIRNSVLSEDAHCAAGRFHHWQRALGSPRWAFGLWSGGIGQSLSHVKNLDERLDSDGYWWIMIYIYISFTVVTEDGYWWISDQNWMSGAIGAAVGAERHAVCARRSSDTWHWPGDSLAIQM